MGGGGGFVSGKVLLAQVAAEVQGVEEGLEIEEIYKVETIVEDPVLEMGFSARKEYIHGM